MKSKDIIITCEHAGNEVPETYKNLFEQDLPILDTHRGYDIGALELTQSFARQLDITPYVHSVTRLLVDLNRSLHSSELFSEYMESIDREKKESVLQEYYEPHRNNVENEIRRKINNGYQVLHLSVHTFTPKLNGTVRDADVGLLFDPERDSEVEFCQTWKTEIEEKSNLNVRFNYPYPGVMDGFSTYLRKQFELSDYAGLELEVNQKFPQYEDSEGWQEIQKVLGESLQTTYLSWTQ